MLMIYESCKQVQQFDYDFEKSIYKKAFVKIFLKKYWLYTIFESRHLGSLKLFSHWFYTSSYF